MPTPISDAFIRLWIFPRTKQVSTGHFFALPSVGPSFQIPCSIKKQDTPDGATESEQQGFVADIFLSGKYRNVWFPSSREPATVRRTSAFRMFKSLISFRQ